MPAMTSADNGSRPPVDRQNDSRPVVDDRNDARPRLGVLISGRGSNLQSIIDAISAGELAASIGVVISNRADAQGLQRARDAGIEATSLSPRDYADRDAYDRALVDLLLARRVSLVCLAGFMRLVGQPLLDAFPNRILNIHPSLLPAFPGLEAQRQALEYGVQVTGATVHLVTSELDGGPIVLQAAVPCCPTTPSIRCRRVCSCRSTASTLKRSRSSSR